ncbi:armadillo-type protein [Desarmillaria ectypa]|nr:armadillo-type protein [Desarmillaria ectypa]
MSAYELFTSTFPWGVLPEKHIYQLVVYENSRPDRPDPAIEARVGLTDHIWGIIEESWHKESRLRPSFDIIIRLWQSTTVDVPGKGKKQQVLNVLNPTSPSGGLASRFNDMSIGRVRSLTQSIRSLDVGPPAYEASTSMAVPSGSPVLPESAPARFHISPPPPFGGRDGDVRSASPRSTGSISPQPSGRPAPLPSSSYRENRHTVPSNFEPTSTWDTGNSSFGKAYTPNLPVFPEDERFGRRSVYAPSSAPPMGLGRSDSTVTWQPNRRAYAPSQSASWDRQSIRSDNVSGSSVTQPVNAVLLVGALQSEAQSTRSRDAIDSCLVKVHFLAQSDKGAERLVTAGIVPTLIYLLKIRAANGEGLEIVLACLGLVAHDSISANTIFRTNTVNTLIELVISSLSQDVVTLAIWCLHRMCRTPEISTGLIRRNLVRVLIERGIRSSLLTARMSAWCLGILIHTDAQADQLNDVGVIPEIVEYLRRASSDPNASPDDVSAALYAIARIARSIKLGKTLAKAGCVEWMSQHLASSTEPSILLWAARAVGCMMRPNSADISKILLEAGIAKGLARLPSVLPSDEVEPLGSFAFAVQRFSCAEWGSGTRKALVDAGVVDSLLAALRTVADEPKPQIHVEMALAVSFLGDVGGAAIRKEIISAGGITILKRVGANGSPEVAKACGMAVTSITGNLWTRNAASAKTAMTHNWSGGCPDYYVDCPVALITPDVP